MDGTRSEFGRVSGLASGTLDHRMRRRGFGRAPGWVPGRGPRAFLAVAAVAIALSGCAPSADEPTPVTATPWPPQTTASPTGVVSGADISQMSDEDAAEVAAQAWEEYWKAGAQVYDQGHDDDGALDSLTTPNLYAQNQEAIADAATKDWRFTGAPHAYNQVLISRTDGAVPQFRVALCGDLTKLVAIDSNGDPVRTDPAPNRASMLVTIIWQNNGFRIDSIDRFDEDDRCKDS